MDEPHPVEPLSGEPRRSWLRQLIHASVEHRFLVLFAALFIALLGVRSMQRLPLDAVPDITNVQVQVLTDAPALGPLEVEQYVTFPVESAMSGLPQLAELRSVSRFGLSAVTVVFEEGTDIYFARQLVGERLAEAKEQIPSAYGTPKLGPISTGLGEIYQFEVRSSRPCPQEEQSPGGEDTDNCHSAMELRSLLDWKIARWLRAVPGVVEVNSFGGELKTFEVAPDPRKLLALEVTLDELFYAIEQNNRNAGGGYLVHGGEQRLIRGEGLLQDLNDLRSVVVRGRDSGVPVRVGDVAEVRFAPMLRQGAVTRDGRGEVVTGIVMMLLGENSREVARAVEARVEEIQDSLPPHVTIDTFYDRTELVDRTIATVAQNLVEGGLLVVIVLFLLIGNLRAGLLVASVIPLSLLMAFMAMEWLSISGNLMSLGALDFGLVVDGAVVVVESAVRSLMPGMASQPRAFSDDRARRTWVKAQVGTAVRRVASPVIFSVLIIMIVYAPVLTLQGVEGKMFRPMAITVVFALGASLLLSLTLMPAGAAWLFGSKHGLESLQRGDTLLLRSAKRVYGPMLAWALSHGRTLIATAAGVFVLSLALIPFLGAQFLPRLEEGALAAEAFRLPSVSLETSVVATTQIEKVAKKAFPDEIDTVISRTGRPEIATDPMGVQQSDIYFMLKPRGDWKRASSQEELARKLEQTLRRQVPGHAYLFLQPIELRMNELISGTRSDLALHIYGTDLDTLAQLGEQAASELRQVPGASQAEAEQVAGLPYLRVIVDRDAAGRYGVDAASVLRVVETLGGKQVGSVYQGEERYAVQVRFPPDVRNRLEDLARLPVPTARGNVVSLAQVAELRPTTGPAQISREAVQRRTTVQVDVSRADMAGFVKDAKAHLAKTLSLPAGYTLRWGGNFKNLAAAFERLAFVVPAALMLVFLLLYGAFASIRPALLVYLNVPLAATGGLCALALRGMPLSVSAAVGFIALFGIAVMNGVVLISAIEDREREGMSREAAVREGAHERLRPVLMTALTDILGFLPMAISTSAGAEVQRPLATVVIGGLLCATTLTLLVLPVLYLRYGNGSRELAT